MARYRPPTFSQDLEAALSGPLIHRLGHDLAAVFTRRRRHPLALHLGYLALQRAIGSVNRLDAELAAPGVWTRAVDAYNRGATGYGDGRTLGPHLPAPNVDTFRRARDTLVAPANLDRLVGAATTRAVELAVEVGLLPEQGGSLTHPSPLRTVYGDGTIVRPLYRPDTPGRTDPEAEQHHNHEGPHWGNNFVLAYCRGTEPHQRIILGVARVEQPGREADTAVDLFRRIVPTTDGRVQAIVYDGAFRGVHHNTLMRELGVVVITKVHAAARRDGAKIVRTLPLGTRTHDPAGVPCSHTLVIHDGAIHEATIDAAGGLRITDPLQRKQVRRARSGSGYRLSLGVIVACPREPFVAWLSVHPHADQLRLLPESDPDFPALYGLRNDAESNNNSYKRTLPQRRAAALGWRRQLLDVTGWAILVNARAHQRYGPEAPELPAPMPQQPLGTLVGPEPVPSGPRPSLSPPTPTRHGRVLTNLLAAISRLGILVALRSDTDE